MSRKESAPPVDYAADYAEEERTQHIKSREVEIPDDDSERFSFRKLWAFTGPGFLMSIAYVDPGNLESDLQAGSVAGYQLIWVLWWSTCAGLLLQILAARLGTVTGRNLAEECRAHVAPPIRYTLWIMMEIAIIASDIQEVIGSAIAIRILSRGAVPLWAGSVITAVDSFLFLFLEQYGLRKLEAMFAALITCMSITFCYIYIVSKPSQYGVMYGLLVPDCSADAVDQAIGVLGAVIMPHNLYLHSSLVVSRQIDIADKKKVREANLYYGIECSIALGVSFVVNLFVIAVFAKAFFGDPNAANIDLLSAGDYLDQAYGSTIKYIWAIGLLAAGQSSTLTGTYAGQIVMEGFLKLKIKPWKRVTLTRCVALVPTISVALFARSGTLNHMNEYLNVLQSIMLPFALLPVLHFTSIKGIMGDFANGKMLKFLGWSLGVGVFGINVYLVYDTIMGDDRYWYLDAGIGVLTVAYSLFVFYLALGPFFDHFGPMFKVGTLRKLYKSVDKHVYDIQNAKSQITMSGGDEVFGEEEDDPLLNISTNSS